MDDKELLTNKIISKLHRCTLKIPSLEGYNLIKSRHSPIILLAKAKDNSTLEFIEDRKLKDGETFEERLKEIMEEEKSALHKNSFETKTTFLEEFQGQVLNFKLYKIDTSQKGKQVIQINAYFIEPESNYVYLIALTSPPLEKSNVNDFITQNIIQKLKEVLANIEYNDQRPF